ncbi:LOW QUALITY PROTEIN: hypothetical protein ACHAWU_009701 [Discostella pseudostelligera]|uniref:Calmodulin n=1 Tax=Discostella pseudostelligera TaxID=259834 RepID=A0ABD3MPP2_9STRA
MNTSLPLFMTLLLWAATLNVVVVALASASSNRPRRRSLQPATTFSWSSPSPPESGQLFTGSSSSITIQRRQSVARMNVKVVVSRGIDEFDDYNNQSSSSFSNNINLRSDNDIIEQQLQNSFPFPLDAWQLAAGSAILSDQNVIVCAPTGAGKTVVGEMALRIALERNKKAIYTTPLKALSNQKFGEMRKVFGVDRVGLATGDVSIRRGADVTIMTTEVYRNMASRASSSSSSSSASSLVSDTLGFKDGLLRDTSQLLDNARSSKGSSDEYDDLSSNSIVVLDEFHYMGQKGRGSTWEECIIFNPTHTQIVGLSATLPNANRLAAWMESVTGRKSVLIEANDKRPVPLRYYFTSKWDFAPLFRDEEAGPGSPHGLLGLRGDGVPLTPKLLLTKKKVGFGKNNESSSNNRNGMPRGLDLNPILQTAAERRMAIIDRQIQRIIERESYNEYGGYGRESTISSREQRKMKENMLKAELRKSVPSIAALLRSLQKRDMLPAIFFIFSRQGCDNAAAILTDSLKTQAEEKSKARRTTIVDPTNDGKGKLLKGKGRGRGRRHANNNESDQNNNSEGEIFVDENGRHFRADLLDQLLSDDYDTFTAREGVVGNEDNDSFLSEKSVRYYADIGLLSVEEVQEVLFRVQGFNRGNPEIAFDDATVEQLLCGIGSHHAGILPAHKAFVESLFRVELMKVVFATETLAAGINMPARTTVICSMAKRGDLGMELLETHNMLQMAGRAGRRGMDVEGACVIAATPFEGPEDAITILTNEIKPVVSQFSPSYALAVNLIERGGGKLDVAKNMIQKSFAVWESRQREEDLQAALEVLDSDTNGLLPEEQFLNALQLTLEMELLEARDGTSRTGTSPSKIAKLGALVDILADGKQLNKISKRYSSAAQILDLERSTLQVMERELKEMSFPDPSIQSIELDDHDKTELLSEIKRQRQRVKKGETEVNDSIISAMAKVANNRMKDEDDESKILSKALMAVRLQESIPIEAPLQTDELNEFIKISPKNNRRPFLDKTTAKPSEDSEDESWGQMQALHFGGLRMRDARAYRRTDDSNYKLPPVEARRSLEWIILCRFPSIMDSFPVAFQDALDDFEEVSGGQGVDELTVVPKPQMEAEVLTNYLCRLTASEMAGYVSSLVVDAPRRSDSALANFQKLTLPQQRVVQTALLSLERLVEVQRRLGLDESIGKCQLELGACDVVTAWASGCSWNEALEISGAAPGDLVRTLSRALDALRQLGNLPYIPARSLDKTVCLEARGIHPRIRSLCRDAATEMDRYPVKDMLPFEEEESDSVSDEDQDVIGEAQANLQEEQEV